MAYSEELAQRVRDVIGGRSALTERKMFGGLAFMVGGNMACGVMGDRLMLRIDRDEMERFLSEPHVGPMDFTGRVMKGFVVVEAEGVSEQADLARWVDTGADQAASMPAK